MFVSSSIENYPEQNYAGPTNESFIQQLSLILDKTLYSKIWIRTADIACSYFKIDN